jgi:hypothetical protein
MSDPREQILARLVEIGGTIPAFKSVARNFIGIAETAMPAFVVLDGDESAEDTDRPSRGPTAPRVVVMTPEVFILLPKESDLVGTALNELRALVINAIATDATLTGLTLNGHGARYEGAATSLSRARSLLGEAGLAFSFPYLMRPGAI